MTVNNGEADVDKLTIEHTGSVVDKHVVEHTGAKAMGNPRFGLLLRVLQQALDVLGRHDMQGLLFLVQTQGVHFARPLLH